MNPTCHSNRDASKLEYECAFRNAYVGRHVVQAIDSRVDVPDELGRTCGGQYDARVRAHIQRHLRVEARRDLQIHIPCKHLSLCSNKIPEPTRIRHGQTHTFLNSPSTRIGSTLRLAGRRSWSLLECECVLFAPVYAAHRSATILNRPSRVSSSVRTDGRCAACFAISVVSASTSADANASAGDDVVGSASVRTRIRRSPTATATEDFLNGTQRGRRG